MAEYAYMAIAIGLGVAFFVLMYIVQTRRNAAGASKQSWLSFWLVWPVILDVDQGKRDGRFLTGREWLGWGLVILIAILAIVFT